MKRYLLIALLSWSQLVWAQKAFFIDEVLIDASVDGKGNMHVTEERLYRFQGDFSYAYRILPKQKGIDFLNFQVWEDGQELPKSHTEMEGFFVVYDRSQEYEVGWAFTARDESKRFKISYTIEGLVQKHEDVAVLYYKFIDNSWGMAQSNIKISVRADKSSMGGEVLHWLHAPGNSHSLITNEGVIELNSPEISRRNFIELRALYPTDWFPESPQKPGLVAEAIRAEEAAWMEDANKKREQALRHEAIKQNILQSAPRIATIWMVVMLIFAFQLYSKYKNPNPDFKASAGLVLSPPSGLHPVLVNYLMKGYHGTQDLAVTIYQLAFRKIIRIVDNNQTGKNNKKHMFYELDREAYERQKEVLLDFEVALVALLFDDIAKRNNSISLDKVYESPTKWQRFIVEMNKQVKAHSVKLGIWNEESQRGQKLLWALMTFNLASFILGVIYLQLWSALLLITALFIIFIANKVRYRNEPYASEYFQWKAYKETLLGVSKKQIFDQLPLDRINEHLVFGVLFGLKKSQISFMIEQLPNDVRTHSLYWYHITGPNRDHTTVMASSISNLTANIVPQFTGSTSGGGGGASFGGGGGFSGGGGGAR
jgi:uncharacterized membrane protein